MKSLQKFARYTSNQILILNYFLNVMQKKGKRSLVLFLLYEFYEFVIDPSIHSFHFPIFPSGVGNIENFKLITIYHKKKRICTLQTNFFSFSSTHFGVQLIIHHKIFVFVQLFWEKCHFVITKFITTWWI